MILVKPELKPARNPAMRSKEPCYDRYEPLRRQPHARRKRLRRRLARGPHHAVQPPIERGHVVLVALSPVREPVDELQGNVQLRARLGLGGRRARAPISRKVD